MMLEDKLKALREEWKVNPEKRWFIEKQAKSVMNAIEFYRNRPPKTAQELSTAEVLGLFQEPEIAS